MATGLSEERAYLSGLHTFVRTDELVSESQCSLTTTDIKLKNSHKKRLGRRRF